MGTPYPPHPDLLPPGEKEFMCDYQGDVGVDTFL